MNAQPHTLPDTPLRAVLYLRQSTYREESASLEEQEFQGRQYAARMGYTIVGVEADPGLSGRTWNRPAVQRVMQMLERGDADRIILWKWSRLSRDDFDWAVARKIARTAGGRIESATEPNDEETPEGRLMLSQMIAFAVYESDRIGSVWKETHARRRRAGMPHSGVDRYGYAKLDDGGYDIDPGSGPVLAEAYERYARGESFTRITRWMNDAGHRTLAGRPWGRVTLTQMLDSGFGAGLLIHRQSAGRRGPRSAEYSPGAHPAVIDKATWDAYSARRAETPAPPRVVEPEYMLAGLVKCGDCGAAMHSSGAGAEDSYVCSRGRADRTIRGVTMRRVLVERVVTEWVHALAADVDALARVVAQAREKRVQDINERAAVERQIAKTDQQLAQLTVRWMDGRLLEAAYNATAATLSARRESLSARIAAHDTVARRREVDVRGIAVGIAEQWDRYTVLEKRSALQALVGEVVVNPASRPGTGVWRDRVEVIPAWSD